MRAKRLAATAFAAALLAALPSNASAATTAGTWQPCWDGSLRMPHLYGSVPVAHHHGQKLYLFTPVYNPYAITRPGQNLFVDIDAKGFNAKLPPVIWWRVDHGPWNFMRFTWHRGGGPADPTWQTAELPMGSFAPRQSRTIELSISFPNNGSWGWYHGYESISSNYCETHGPWEQGFSAFSVVNRPDNRT